MKVKCAYCGKCTTKSTGHCNRAKKLDMKLYCSQKCFGLDRRNNETDEEKKQIKAWYDGFIRASMTDDDRDLDYLLNAVYFQWDYENNPQKYKDIRNKRMPYHLEYCRRSEYKQYKKGYDEQYRAKKNFGAFWECAIILKNLDNEIDYRESKRQNKIYNKSTSKRKRQWQKQLKQNIKNLQRLI